MSQLPNRDQIKVGMKVFVELKQDQGTGKLTEATVKKILTSENSHPHGIMVELENALVGRVKKLSELVSHEPSKFEDLDKKQVPGCEDKFNEFKEFYQYDDGLDGMPDSIPADKKSQIMEAKKEPVRERFATAICSFGNDRGGFLYLGVNSSGEVVGLEKDKRVGNFSDYDDDFANHIRDTLGKFIDNKVFIINKLQIKFTKRNDNTICIIQILPSSEPLFLKTKNGKEFHVRGPSPRAEHLEGSEMIEYINQRFPNRH